MKRRLCAAVCAGLFLLLTACGGKPSGLDAAEVDISHLVMRDMEAYLDTLKVIELPEDMAWLPFRLTRPEPNITPVFQRYADGHMVELWYHMFRDWEWCVQRCDLQTGEWEYLVYDQDAPFDFADVWNMLAYGNRVFFCVGLGEELPPFLAGSPRYFASSAIYEYDLETRAFSELYEIDGSNLNVENNRYLWACYRVNYGRQPEFWHMTVLDVGTGVSVEFASDELGDVLKHWDQDGASSRTSFHNGTVIYPDSRLDEDGEYRSDIVTKNLETKQELRRIRTDTRIYRAYRNESGLVWSWRWRAQNPRVGISFYDGKEVFDWSGDRLSFREYGCLERYLLFVLTDKDTGEERYLFIDPKEKTVFTLDTLAFSPYVW